MSTDAVRYPIVAVVADQQFGQLWWNEEEVVGIDVLPAASAALTAIVEKGVPVWLLADLDEAACENLHRWLPTMTGVRSLGGDGLAAGVITALAGLSETGVLAAADRELRAAAAHAGWDATIDPVAASWMIDGHDVCLARIIGGDAILGRLPQLIVAAREDGGVLAFTTPTTLARAASAGAGVQRLPIDLAREDAIWVRTAGTDRFAATEAFGRRTVLTASGSTALVAVPAGDYLEEPELHTAHGHFGLLTPTPAAVRSPASEMPADADLTRWPWPELPESPVEPLIRPPQPCRGWSTAFTDDTERYAGLRPIDEAGAIVSRHVRHPDNERAVDALLADLRSIGYCPWVHSFTHAGRTVRNVFADLPARGRFTRPKFMQALRNALAGSAALQNPEEFAGQLDAEAAATLPPELNRRLGESAVGWQLRLRHALRLYPWSPWWQLRCLLAGSGARIVIVGCHLDSTASRDAGYDPLVDPAPGADDDASGIAGTLAVARWMWKFRNRLPNTVRFAFFNAEEAGLVGSAAYAAHLAAFAAPVEAVVCMDMIGYDSDPTRLFEVHAGHPTAAIRDASVPIAERIASWTSISSSLPVPQIYRGTISAPGPDRTTNDGAINRSDHASFQANGFPAVLVSEDFFANLPSEPASDANPAYHRSADSTVNADYGAAIACVVAHTVRDLATNGL